MRVFVSKRQRKKRAQRRLILGLIAVLLVAAIGGWLYGFIAYVKAMPQPDRRQQGVTSGAAVVLTGGPLRVTSGLALLTSGQIEQLLISGVHADFSTRSLTAIARGAKLDTKLDRLISCCITLGYAAHDTVGNAKETALWAALYGSRQCASSRRNIIWRERYWNSMPRCRMSPSSLTRSFHPM